MLNMKIAKEVTLPTLPKFQASQEILFLPTQKDFITQTGQQNGKGKVIDMKNDFQRTWPHF